MTADVKKLFENAGLTAQKAEETMKNKVLSAAFEKAIKNAESISKVDKSVGNFLYQISSKVKNFEHLDFLSGCIARKELRTDVQLNFAIMYLKSKPQMPVDKPAFDKECGVGINVTPEQIETECEKLVNKFEKELKEQRYKLLGKLLGEARKDPLLKFADGKNVKREIEVQILDMIGEKTQEDLNKNKKKKEKPAAESKSKAEPEVETLSLMEQLRGAALKFHKPGENYTTDGYVTTKNTMKHMEEHLKFTKGQVRTRFPPEPNGILHIGHAKAINFNFGYAKANDGICYLRYDDTNPEKEEEKFFTGILDMVRWLGYEPYKITAASDNFEKLYQLAIKLIKEDLAYICHQEQSEIQGHDPADSPWRNRPIEESLQLFEDMKNGKIDEGKATLRMKHIMEDGKKDPVAYRIKFAAHHRTGNNWCIYPTYDFTHCLCDSIENISHSLCTKEFQARRSSYYWLCNAVDIYCPVQWEYGRLNLHYTVVSKRKIAKLIEKGIVSDWDDPRLFTLSALRRRGFPAEGINNFCAQVGITGNQVVIEPSMLEHCIRTTLNTTAKRRMVVKDPLKVNITNFKDYSGDSVEVFDFPADKTGEKRSVSVSDTIYIEQDDFMLKPSKGYKRFSPEQTVALRHAGMVLTYQSHECDKDGKVTSVDAKFTLIGDSPKPKGFIHWVSEQGSEECEIRMYSRLFKHKNPEDKSVVPGGFVTDCNLDSLKVLHSARMEKGVSGAEKFTTFQFERLGYFCVDPDSSGEKMVFNLTIPLKEDSKK